MKKERYIETDSIILGMALLYAVYWAFEHGKELGRALAHTF